ncbi:MAG: hypothetical protein HC825_02790 [Oscillatoriales cyanobacterium RM1_1_9]|nr:hypothetical protein [Oscillatoriales cyanobacterium RM1_1_9]
MTELPQFLNRATQVALDYWNSLSVSPVAQLGLSQLPKTLPETLAAMGWGTAQTLEKFQREILPGLSASAGGRYWGFVTGGTTPAALVGDWLVTATDQNLMVPGDSIATALELATLDLLKQLFDLPVDQFAGSLTTGPPPPIWLIWPQPANGEGTS